MKRKWTILVLFWFLVGGLLIPSLHPLQHLQKGGEHDCACHHHTEPVDSSGGCGHNEPHHDHSTCLICLFSAMSFEMPLGIFVPSLTGQTVYIVFLEPCTPDFLLPRLLPFSCGPPLFADQWS